MPYLSHLPRGVIIYALGPEMGKTSASRLRLRFILIAIILASIPCYCAGLAMVRIARRRAALPTFTPTSTATASLTFTATWTLTSTASTTPRTPTLTSSATVTLTPTATPLSHAYLYPGSNGYHAAYSHLDSTTDININSNSDFYIPTANGNGNPNIQRHVDSHTGYPQPINL